MYKECINCPKLGDSCDGPNFMGMTAAQLLAWCKERKNYLHLTNAKLAELSGMAKGTIDRLLAGEQADFRYESIRPMIKTLVGGRFEGNPCPDPDAHTDEQKIESQQEIIMRLEAENARLLLQLEYMEEQHHKDAAEAKEDHKRAVDFLKDQLKYKRIAIITLGIFLAICVAVIVAALIIDRLNADVGFFWIEEMFNGHTNRTFDLFAKWGM